MSKNKNEDKELVDMLLKLNIKYAIEDSNINMKMIDSRIKFYQTLINHLEDKKPFFFQKRNLLNITIRKKNIMQK